MASRTGVFSTSVGTKILIGITGLALLLYLLIHIAGNLLIFFGPQVFNTYAYTMEVRNPALPAIEIALKKHGKADRQTIRAALKEVDVKDSPLGPIKFDDHHQAWINMILIEMRDGQLRILEKLPTSPALLN